MAFPRILVLPVVLLLILVLGLTIMPFNVFWYAILPIVGFVFLAVVSWVIPLLWYRLVPYAARKLTEAARTKSPPAIIVHDTGRATITLLQERRGEGLVVTDQGNYKILPKYASIPDKTGNPSGGYTNDYRDIVLKRSILMGLGLPIFFGYSGKLCLMNPEALALYTIGEYMIQTAEGTPLFNPNKKKDKELPDALQPLMLLDPRKLSMIEGYDETQIAAVVTESEEIGRLGRGFGKFLLPIGIIMIAVIAIIGVLFFLPQLGLG